MENNYVGELILAKARKASKDMRRFKGVPLLEAQALELLNPKYDHRPIRASALGELCGYAKASERDGRTFSERMEEALRLRDKPTSPANNKSNDKSTPRSYVEYLMMLDKQRERDECD